MVKALRAFGRWWGAQQDHWIHEARLEIHQKMMAHRKK
jgi:hypothetical protein